MARPVTFIEMRDRARQYADMVNSQFIDEDELKGYLNDSLADLYDQLVAAYGEDYYATTTTFTTVLNQTHYPFSTVFGQQDNFYKLLNMYRVNDTVSPHQNLGILRRFERSEIFITTMSWNAQWPCYRLEGQQVVLSPAPYGGMVIRVDYVPVSPKLSGDLDTFDGINGYEDWAVLDAACKMLDKEESDTRALVARKDRIEVRIQQMGAARDASQASRVTDCYRDDQNYWGWYPPT